MTPEQSADAAPPLTAPAPSAPGAPVHPAATADPAIPPPMETRGLDAFFGRHHAVQSIDLLFPENSVTAIIGPSGCGKSTFLRCLLGAQVDDAITRAVQALSGPLRRPTPARARPVEYERAERAGEAHGPDEECPAPTGRVCHAGRTRR